jgi:hypothetical protein
MEEKERPGGETDTGYRERERETGRETETGRESETWRERN